jgi:hypothetical protein
MFDSSEFEFADISVSILGANLSGLRGLVYKKTQKKEPVYGQGNQPKAIQKGNKAYEGTLKVLKSDYDLLDAAAVAAGYEDITDVPEKLITMTCVYQRASENMLSTDILIGCGFTDAEDGMNQGDPFKEVSLPFMFLRKNKATV